jgi:hypothetical protein
MKRLLLVLPVVAVGGILAGYLIYTVETSSAPDGNPEPPPVTIDQTGALPDAAGMDKLAATDPVAFLEDCIRRYDRDVKGYSATLYKHERIDGTLYPPEVLQVRFCEQPFSVWLHWLEGERRAKTALYVAGANDNKIIVQPTGLTALLGTMQLAVDSPLARASGRYTMDQFGLEKGTLRTLSGWVEAQRRGGLHVEYLGKKTVAETGGQLCYCFHRIYDQPSPNGVDDLILYIDVKNWLQVGSIVKDKDGNLVAEYYFRDIQLNPKFKPEQFSPASVKS